MGKQIPGEIKQCEHNVLYSVAHYLSLLVQKKWLTSLEELNQLFFATDEAKCVLNALKKCKINEQGNLDLTFITKHLKAVTYEKELLNKCVTFLSNLYINPEKTEHNKEPIITYWTFKEEWQELKDYYIKTEFEAYCDRINKDEKIDPQTKLLYLNRKYEELTEVTKPPKSKTILDVISEYNSALEDVKNNGQEICLASRYPALDQKIKRFGRGQLAIIAARPGIGKTTFALNLIVNNLGWINKEFTNSSAIGVVSIEMTDLELYKKLICISQQCSLTELDKYSNGEFVDPSIKRAVSKAEKELSKSNLLFCEDRKLTIGRLQGYIKNWHKEKPNLNLVIIDYLQLVDPDEEQSKDARHLQVGQVTRELKILAQELNICIIALAQLNRNSETRRSSEKSPILSDLRESGNIEQDADIVMFLYKEEQQTMMTVSKNRTGEIGEVVFDFNRDKGKFKDTWR